MSYLTTEKKQVLQEYLARDAAQLRNLNFGESYIRSTLEITKKWGEVGLLEGITDPYIMRQCARLMENQRIANEGEWNDPQMKRCSIPIVRRVFGQFFPTQWVSVQALPAQTGHIYVTSLDEKTTAVEQVAKNRWIKTAWKPEYDGSGRMSLDIEAEATANYCRDLVDEMSLEVAIDLSNNASSQLKDVFESADRLFGSITGAASYIGLKLGGRDANWLVANAAIVEQLKSHALFEAAEPDLLALSGKTHWAGMLYTNENKSRSIKVYQIEDFYPGKVLLGYYDRKQPYLSGYFYAPFVSVTGNSNESGHYISRYSKKLLEGGGKFYGVLDIDGVPEPTNSSITGGSDA